MHSNYSRLFDELTQLLGDDSVQKNLDTHLRSRANKIIRQKGKDVEKKVSQDSDNECEPLFPKTRSDDLCRTFEPIVLKERDNNRSKSKNSVENSKIKTSKPGESNNLGKKMSQRMLKYNDNKRSVQNTSSQRKQKENIKSSSLLRSGGKSRSKLKSKETVKNPIYNQVLTMSKQKSKKRKQKWKNNKENLKTVESKPTITAFSHQKTQPDSDTSLLVFTKIKSSSKNEQGKSVLRRLAAIDQPPSRFSSHSKKLSQSLEKELKVLETIEQEREEAIDQKLALEDTVQMLRQKMEQEKNEFRYVSLSITRLQNQLQRIQHFQKEKSLEVHLSRKKSETFINESKKLTEKIEKTNKSKDSVLCSISQERYLIQMYQKVIDELKSQLRVEKQQKVHLKKKLSQLKNTQKVLCERCESREALSDQIFNSMRDSLKIWKDSKI